MAMPASAPKKVAASADTTPITIELRAATSISRLLNSLWYQSRVKPTHSALSLESLNEYTTTITSGRYRNT
jgi:hypothetical protein